MRGGKFAGTLVTVVLACTFATACGTDSGPDPDSDPSPTDPQPPTFGAFYGECGSVTDDEVLEITGIAGLRQVATNGIKCRWEAPSGMPYVMFTWYRGSPMDRERLGSELSGRDIEQVTVEGRRAYTSRIPSFPACEVGVEDNDDFIYWLVNYDNTAPATDLCGPPLDLARLTIEKVQ